MREQYYVATPTIILYSQDVPPPSENPESAPVGHGLLTLAAQHCVSSTIGMKYLTGIYKHSHAIWK